MHLPTFRKHLLAWYERHARGLPWRETQDPWRILVSEIMLQQTRVEAVIPYYHRFLEQFPDAPSLARADEAQVLTAWSGLGYYSRARNLRRAAALVKDEFPRDYTAIRALPGIGPYTAAAVASIAFDLPHAAVDGNVLRVIARIAGDPGDISAPVTRQRFTTLAQDWLDPRRPGDFNQAMMELGATVCLPRAPLCLVCPVSRDCAARQQARQNELPVKRPKGAPSTAELTVVVMLRGDRVLVRQRAAGASRMAGFWELPELQDLAALDAVEHAGSFTHTIVNTRYTVRVVTAPPARRVKGLRWMATRDLSSVPFTTASRKALQLLARQRIPSSAPG